MLTRVKTIDQCIDRDFESGNDRVPLVRNSTHLTVCSIRCACSRSINNTMIHALNFGSIHACVTSGPCLCVFVCQDANIDRVRSIHAPYIGGPCFYTSTQSTFFHRSMSTLFLERAYYFHVSICTLNQRFMRDSFHQYHDLIHVPMLELFELFIFVFIHVKCFQVVGF